MELILPDRLQKWQHRAVKATGGNKSHLGCIVLAILGWQNGRKPPRFGKIAVILNDNDISDQCTIMSNFQGKDGRAFSGQKVGTVAEVRDSMRGLADHLKLNDIDRLAMFEELRKWCAVDHRSTSGDWV